LYTQLRLDSKVLLVGPPAATTFEERTEELTCAQATRLCLGGAAASKVNYHEALTAAKKTGQAIDASPEKASGTLSFSWFVVLLRRLVCTRQACCLFALVALLLLPLSFFLGVRVSSLPHGRFMNSQLLDVAHCSFSHQLLCFGFWLHWR